MFSYEGPRGIRQGLNGKLLVLDIHYPITNLIEFEPKSKSVKAICHLITSVPKHEVMHLIGRCPKTGAVYVVGFHCKTLWRIDVAVGYIVVTKMDASSFVVDHFNEWLSVTVLLDTQGNLIWNDPNGHVIWTASVTEKAVQKRKLLAGIIGQPGYDDSHDGLLAKFDRPGQLSMAPNGKRLLCCDIGNHALRIIDLEHDQHSVSTLFRNQGLGSWAFFDARGDVVARLECKELIGAPKQLVKISPSGSSSNLMCNAGSGSIRHLDVYGNLWEVQRDDQNSVDFIIQIPSVSTSVVDLVQEALDSSSFSELASCLPSKDVLGIVAEYLVWPVF